MDRRPGEEVRWGVMRPEIESTPDGPRAAGSSPELLGELLDAYLERLIALGVPLHDWLNPGADPDEVRRQVAELGYEAPKELVVWFSRLNGRVMDEGYRGLTGSAFPWFIPASLEGAIIGYQRLREMPIPRNPFTGDDDFTREVLEGGESPGWLLLADVSWGLTIELDAQAVSPRIRFSSNDFVYDETGSLYRAVSLCTMVTWWLEALDNGSVTWVPATMTWDCDPTRFPQSQRDAGF